MLWDSVALLELTSITQFFVASAVYYITSVIWPAKETMLDRAILGFEDDVVDDRSSEVDTKEKGTAQADVREV
jgi:hypothetical protein